MKLIQLSHALSYKTEDEQQTNNNDESIHVNLPKSTQKYDNPILDNPHSNKSNEDKTHGILPTVCTEETKEALAKTIKTTETQNSTNRVNISEAQLSVPLTTMPNRTHPNSSNTKTVQDYEVKKDYEANKDTRQTITRTTIPI